MAIWRQARRMSNATPPLTPHDLVRVAAHAGVDPRAVRRFTLGAPMRSTTRARVLSALRALGLVSDGDVNAPCSALPKI